MGRVPPPRSSGIGGGPEAASSLREGVLGTIAHDDAILCETHLDQLDQGIITWNEYRALQAHYEIA